MDARKAAARAKPRDRHAAGRNSRAPLVRTRLTRSEAATLHAWLRREGITLAQYLRERRPAPASHAKEGTDGLMRKLPANTVARLHNAAVAHAQALLAAAGELGEEPGSAKRLQALAHDLQMDADLMRRWHDDYLRLEHAAAAPPRPAPVRALRPSAAALRAALPGAAGRPAAAGPRTAG